MMKVHLSDHEPKLYFQVMIEYEACEATANIPEDERKMESAAIDEFEKAEEIAKHTIQQIHTKFPDMNIIELALDQADDGYHLLVVDDAGDRVVKVGVTFTDYSEETIH
jgi:hypothetical protein